jgi:flagellar protein FliL
MMADAKKTDKDEEEGKEQVPEKKKGSALKWIIISVIAVLVLGGAGAGAYFFLFHSKAPGDKKTAEHAKPVVAIFWPMDPFIVNLIDNEGERYMKVSMQLEVAEQATVEELNIIKPKIRDSILDLLSAKTYKEMIDPIGKQRLRDEIAMRANGYLTKGKIAKVYFTEFVIQ